MKIKILNQSKNPLPIYQTSGSAGMDVHANISNKIELKPFERKLIPTGLFVEIPQGFEIQVRPRSGLALKHGITVLNSPGTIDSDFRGELMILLVNLGNEIYHIESGERIAQLVIASVITIEWEPINTLSETDRGTGGYGSSGK
jgi:dUTP pyrophosphatase